MRLRHSITEGAFPMIRLKTALVVAALALIGAGCHDSSQPRPAKVVKAQTTRVKQSSDGRAGMVVAEGQGSAQKSEAWVIEGDDDTPKPVKPEVKQGRGKAEAKLSRPTKPVEPPKPEEPTFTVAGGFLKTKEKAKEDAIRAAVEKLHDYLQQQEPPVKRMPTFEMVQSMLITHPEASESDAEIGKVTAEQVPGEQGKLDTMYMVEVAVKVRPEHVRELRSQERSSEALWVLAGLGGLAAVIAVFFKIDSWTKGYLTSWLVLGMIGAGSLLLGLWWWAK
jgi:hypothetical protein